MGLEHPQELVRRSLKLRVLEKELVWQKMSVLFAHSGFDDPGNTQEGSPGLEAKLGKRAQDLASWGSGGRTLMGVSPLLTLPWLQAASEPHSLSGTQFSIRSGGLGSDSCTPVAWLL